MKTLREALHEYLELRRSMGYKMHDAGLMLPRFVSFMAERGAKYITVRLALEWVQQAKTIQPAERARRLCFVRGFARYRSAVDPRTEVPPPGLLPYRSTRARPYLYSDQEVQRLLDEALKLPTTWPSTPLRPWVFHCLLGLLSVTGMRISETLDLRLDDVDLDQGVLTIRSAKLGRFRLVPLHRSTCAVLANYLKRREQSWGKRGSGHVFVSNRGTRLDIGRVHRTFYALSRQVGLRAPGASKGPRLHDFRHRFAVEVLTRWYESGEDPAQRLPMLSTYLGHVYVCQESGFRLDKPGMVYYARITDGESVFWKIGITNRTVGERFSGPDLSKVQAIEAWEFDTGADALQLEQEILNEYSVDLYRGDTKPLEAGNTELFMRDVLKLDTKFKA